ncbi:MAG: hypothetical protein WCK32_09050 [Chlorobiaceae bacterium]
MSEKEKALSGANRARPYQGYKKRKDQSRQEYSHTTSNLKPFDMAAHIRAINRAIVDACYHFKDWPKRMRLSCSVNTDGKLISRPERRRAV